MSVTLCRRAQTRSTPKAKREARVNIGIVADGAKDIGIDHAGAAHLDPAIAPAHVDFDTRLGEREERRAEADMHIAAKEARGEQAAACS